MKQTQFKVVILAVLALLTMNGCGSSGKEGMKTEIIEGVAHVYSPATPLYGDAVLDLEEKLRIDSQDVEAGSPPSFGLYQADSDGNIYLCHQSEPRIYKFDNHGKFLFSFVKKGEGPGEFPQSIYDLQVSGNSVWAAYSRKIARFDLKGNYLDEHIFDRNITLVEMVDNESLLGNYYLNDRTDERMRVCARLSLSGKEIVSFMSDPAAGFTRIRVENRMYSFFHGMITNDFLHAYDRQSQMVYLFLANQPVIYRKTLDGVTDLVIHREIQPVKPGPDDSREFAENSFARWPKELRQAVSRSLPPHFVYHNNIYILPSGNFILRRITGYQKYEMDIFGRDGQFLHTIKPGPLYPDFSRAGFVKNRLVVFQEVDDRDILIIYAIKNLPDIFAN